MEYQPTPIQPTGFSGPAFSDPLAVAAREHVARQEVCDIHGTLWYLLDRRPTKHGFDLLLGRHTRFGAAPPSVILTSELAAYCETHRTDKLARYDLPASVVTIEALRMRLGMNYAQDRHALWLSRAADLQSLTLSKVALRYHVSLQTAANWRDRILGPPPEIRRPRRRPNWWLKAAVLKILRSNMTLKRMGQRLGVSSTYAGILRLRAFSPDPAPRSPRARRPANWWRDPAMLEILLSDSSLHAKSQKLGISLSHTHRLWHCALAL